MELEKQTKCNFLAWKNETKKWVFVWWAFDAKSKKKHAFAWWKFDFKIQNKKENKQAFDITLPEMINLCKSGDSSGLACWAQH